MLCVLFVSFGYVAVIDNTNTKKGNVYMGITWHLCALFGSSIQIVSFSLETGMLMYCRNTRIVSHF